MVLFFILAAVAVLTAISMLASRDAVYSAMFLVLNFVTIAVIYLLLNAAFIAMVQVAVYAGAIMVLFLFVIMLLGTERAAREKSKIPWQRPLAALVVILLIAEMVYIVFFLQGDLLPSFESVTGAFGSPASVGALLFNKYLVPFEVTSILLLVAMVGAIIMTREERKEKR
ncbi:MAG: NADH-quinone oxidoreductase subunit J [Anaerolineales bacterium]|nr:NADH-quinone oxidoreductase subunit J [Anaerolineales bacterium]